MELKIVNKENELGTVLQTYGTAFTIEARYLRVAFVIACMLTVGTNWLIPIGLKRIKNIKIRHENDINKIKNVWNNILRFKRAKR